MQLQQQSQPTKSSSYNFHNNDTTLLQTFIIFLESLGLEIQSYEELFNGKIITLFVSTIEGVELSSKDVWESEDEEEMGRKNYETVAGKVG